LSGKNSRVIPKIVVESAMGMAILDEYMDIFDLSPRDPW
jgi:hypothetical protein